MVKYSDPIDMVFYSLSHPVRREILLMLRSGSQLVTELAAHFDLSLTAISKHIKVLEKARLVDRHRQGRVHQISMNKDALLSAEEWLAQYRQFWQANFDNLDLYFAQQSDEEKK